MLTSYLVSKSARKLMSFAVALSLGVVACSSASVVGPDPESESRVPSQASSSVLSTTLAKYPEVIEGPFGRSDTSLYGASGKGRLQESPYGPKHGSFVVESGHASYGCCPTVEHLVESAHLVARVEVVAIGRPHFNSEDGSFWHRALLADGSSGASWVQRDVVVELLEVYGSRLENSQAGSQMVFTTYGGQVRVTLSEEVARKIEWGPAGDYVIPGQDAVDLATGEQVILFLTKGPHAGYYEGGYALRRLLRHTSHPYFKFLIDGDVATNSFSGTIRIRLDELRSLVSRSLGRDAGEPRDGTTPYRPGRPADQPSHPPPEQGGPD